MLLLAVVPPCAASDEVGLPPVPLIPLFVLELLPVTDDLPVLVTDDCDALSNLRNRDERGLDGWPASLSASALR